MGGLERYTIVNLKTSAEVLDSLMNSLGDGSSVPLTLTPIFDGNVVSIRRETREIVFMFTHLAVREDTVSAIGVAGGINIVAITIQRGPRASQPATATIARIRT